MPYLLSFWSLAGVGDPQWPATSRMITVSGREAARGRWGRDHLSRCPGRAGFRVQWLPDGGVCWSLVQ